MVPISVTQSHEPPATVSLTSETIKSLMDEGGVHQFPIFPAHSQTVERCVKLVSEASSMVCGEEKRHDFINTKILARQLRPDFSSKGKYVSKF